MNFSTIISFIKENLEFVLSACFSAVFFLVNIIQAIRSHNKSKLKAALLSLPEVIREAESYWKDVPQFKYQAGDVVTKNTSLLKKSYVVGALGEKYGRLYKKNKKVFDDAVEDILNTPQKKGGPLDVSQTNEEK